MELNGSYMATDPENPEVDIDLALNDISIPETFEQVGLVGKFAPLTKKILGNFSGKVSLTGLLDQNMMPRLESITGLSNLVTSPLQVTNVNTLDQLSNSLNINEMKNMKINGAIVIVEFLNGIMNLKPLNFKALGIDMSLGGQTSLDQSIAYTLDMKIPRSLMGSEANNVLDGLAAGAGKSGADIKLGEFINVSAFIGGTLQNPEVKLNLAETGKDIIESVKEQVQEEVEEKIEEVKEDLKEDANKYIEEADKKAKAILEEARKQSDEVMKAANKLADETKKQANTSADKIVNEAKGKGFIAEQAAKKSAEEIRKQGDKQAKNILDEAKAKSDDILDKAQQEADKIKEDARKKIDQ
jgi:hypothetical protein